MTETIERGTAVDVRFDVPLYTLAEAGTRRRAAGAVGATESSAAISAPTS